ncbi:hypothetical protein [Anaerotruncus rubiinfantis]|uniref:hypothetical protein n=1 Tax=Anaerotruncus rubiinfantis TaxID=1720200 RepID=UPI00082F2153|nr:hypothetical protein [Anaerotruncus rubiinfantis]
MNADKLKGKIKEHAMTQDMVAKKIGLSLSRFNAKLNGTDGAEFSLGEAQSLKWLFELTSEQVDEIFFT